MNPLSQHLHSLPAPLVSALQTEFQKLHTQYFLGHWEPSQLDGGRFAEIVLRILEQKSKGTFTPLGTQLKRLSLVAAIKQDVALDESLRFHVLGLAELILDFRNKRNVAHPGLVDTNEMDATFVLHAANWIVAELIRTETQMSPADAEAEIKKVIERKVPIIEEIGGRLKCLNPKLKIGPTALVLCYQKYPTPISIDDLYDWTKYSNKSTLRTTLEGLDKKEGLIDFRDGYATLTKRGVLWVEKNIPFELEI